jgi:hypothetical protein
MPDFLKAAIYNWEWRYMEEYFSPLGQTETYPSQDE